MTDRELLEFAAKAAGIEYRSAGYRVTGIGETGMPLLAIWEPLTDDGDALRLAVKLHINIEHLRPMGGAFNEVSASPSGRGDCMAIEPTKGDPCKALRSAIVCAAAAIGKDAE